MKLAGDIMLGDLQDILKKNTDKFNGFITEMDNHLLSEDMPADAKAKFAEAKTHLMVAIKNQDTKAILELTTIINGIIDVPS